MGRGFPHLHVASAYSPHYGVTMLEALVDQAAAAGADFLAFTDRYGLYGAIKHVRACAAAGIRPGLDADLAVHDDEHRPLGWGPCSRTAGAVAGLRAWLRVMPIGSITFEVVCHLAPTGQRGSVAAATRMLGLAEDTGTPVILSNAANASSSSRSRTTAGRYPTWRRKSRCVMPRSGNGSGWWSRRRRRPRTTSFRCGSGGREVADDIHWTALLWAGRVFAAHPASVKPAMAATAGGSVA
ncbi:PHP domain-containing protein [Cryobacterium sp. TMT2-15-1]|uniref:PHP domain-containing protein n=1 Tax=Cryobacterium sp. TMT2-15-1 TaxID=1259246 RepID=UPI001F53EE22|nr:PHP domain-containing protein [Cryobacterium sp. TMT2-15-1]